MRTYNGVPYEAIMGKYWKPIQPGTTLSITIPANMPGGTEFNSVLAPEEEFYILPSYLKLTVPDGIEANIIAVTDAGEFPLLVDNITGTTVELDPSNYFNLGPMRQIVLYAKVVIPPSTPVTVTLELGGKEVVL